MDKPLISIGIIFKNEIRCIERCLKALQPLRDAVTCELVMADTGATDGSREIAEKYADLLIDFPWINDFSAARNAVMDRCSGKWYFSIDCDEWLAPDVSGLVRFAESDEYHDFGSVIIRNYFSEDLSDSDSYADFLGTRLLRMSTGIRYEGTIHEHWPYHTKPGEDVLETRMISGAVLHHDGYAFADREKQAEKEQRNLELLEKKLEENPGDLLTLMQCIESGGSSPKYLDWLREAVKGAREKRIMWELIGPPIMRYAVKSAVILNLPELEEWAAEAEEMFPESIFTRVDVQYYAFGVDWEKKNYASCIRRGEKYLQAVADFKAGKFNRADLLASSLSQASPHCELCVSTVLASAYLCEAQADQCVRILKTLNGAQMDIKQVGDTVRVYGNLYKDYDQVDTAGMLLQFWEKINAPEPTGQRAKERYGEFIRMGSSVFSTAYLKEENKKEGLSRHAYEMYLPLKGKCVLGDAADILCTKDVHELEEKLTGIADFAELPISALFYAFERGVPFPLPKKPMCIEEMDSLASRLFYNNNELLQWAADLDVEAARQEPQVLCWMRGVALAAIRAFPWAGEEIDEDLGLGLIRMFTRVEQAFLPICYAPEILENEDLVFLLPSLHRFAWYCAKAFDALDAGREAEYMQWLRLGLRACEGAKDIVEFLLKQLKKSKESRRVQATPELIILAEQVRMLLARYPADDPAIEALKQSDAYQKVAHLIEGPELGIFGGLKQ